VVDLIGIVGEGDVTAVVEGLFVLSMVGMRWPSDLSWAVESSL
jgi:hypothetical protein